MGLVVVGAFALLNERVGVLGGFSDIVERVTGRRPALGWKAWFALGIVGAGSMWLMCASAVAVGFVGLRLLRRARARSLLTGEPVSWTTARPERRHVVGAVIFGVGWAVSDVCPGPVAAQLGQGIGWSVFL